jgi:uncharacterized protein (DUF1697 family)
VTYIAFLRGINVGGHNVKMAVLREVFESLGYDNVRSYINSGNIFFNAEINDLELATSLIETKLQKNLGYNVPTFLRTKEQVADIIKLDPFKSMKDTEENRFCVVFTKEKLNTSLKLPVISSKNDMEIVKLNEKEAFIVWHIINGRPPAGKFDVDVLPAANTSRFYHTLIKIHSAA